MFEKLKHQHLLELITAVRGSVYPKPLPKLVLSYLLVLFPTYKNNTNVSGYMLVLQSQIFARLV